MDSDVMFLLVGLIIGAGVVVVWLTIRSRSAQPAAALVTQGEMKATLDGALAELRNLSDIFANARQRGRAGEISLENLLEQTGMGRHRDYDTQVTAADGSRPDVVLKLPGRGRLIIDAKFPLDDYQQAAASHDDSARAQHLAAHARAVAGHVKALAQRDYPSSVKDSLDFTVCYVPSDDLLAAAYDLNPGLFYDAAGERVLVTTPVTLLAVLWGIAYGLQRDARVAQARQIGDAAAILHKRAGVTARHMRQAGRSLDAAVKAYNELVGSFEHRLLPQLRRIEGMGILAPGSELPDPQVVERTPRDVAALSSDDGYAKGAAEIMVGSDELPVLGPGDDR